MDNYARLAGKLAADFRCDAVVGHSLGANVAIEMLAAGHFSGSLVLLAPSFSREDESKFPRALDRISRVLGHLPYAAMLKVIGPAMKGSLPPDRSDALIAEMKRNDPRFLQRQTRRYLEYLDRHGSLVSRLCDTGARAWVVFGDHDDIGLADDERRALEECPTWPSSRSPTRVTSRSTRSRGGSLSWSSKWSPRTQRPDAAGPQGPQILWVARTPC